MSVGAVGTQPGVEMKRVQVKTLRFVDHPVHQLPGVPLAAVVESGAEVVAVQCVTPRQHVEDAEPRHSDRVRVLFDEEPDQPVALGPQVVVNVLGEHGLGCDAGPELQHCLVSEMGTSGLELLDHPPIWDMFLAGLMNPGWLIRWPSSLRQTAVSMTRPRWSSDAPDRMSSRSGVSCSENRHVRRPPSAVSLMRLHVVQNAWLTDEMKPTPPGAPSANLKRVAGPGRVSTTGWSGNRSSICSWMRRLGTTWSTVQMLSPSSGMNSMKRTS